MSFVVISITPAVCYPLQCETKCCVAEDKSRREGKEQRERTRHEELQVKIVLAKCMTTKYLQP